MPAWPPWAIGAYAAGLSAVVGVAMWLDLAADRDQQPGLNFLRPAFSTLVSLAPSLRPLILPAIAILPAAALLVAAYFAFARSGWLAAGRQARTPARPPRLATEVLCLGALTLVIVAFRFYALNRVPNDFIGELVLQVLCTSDWGTLLSVSGGSGSAPWAPVGLLHYLLTGAVWRFSGSTVLTLCFASAVSSVLLTLVLYVLVRALGGPLAALVAAAFYAASPLETAWGRHSMQPFNYPAVFVLLPALSTYLAITRHRLSYWLATAFLMGLCHQSFGSAYAGFLIPIGTVAWLLVFDRDRLRRSGWYPLALLLGLGLWLIGPALSLSAGAGQWRWISPLDPRLDSRAFRGAGWAGSIAGLIENARIVLTPLYSGATQDTHQTPTGVFLDEHLLYLSPIATILFTVGLVWMFVNRRKPAVPVLASLLVAAAIPGLISYADPHRLAAFYPAVCAVAGCTAAAGLAGLRSRFPKTAAAATGALVLIALPLALARSGALYFSRPEGEPPTQTIARTIKAEVAPDTLLVLDLPFGLMVDTSYLLFDASLVEPFGWMFIDEDKWREEFHDFKPRFADVFHVDTALRHRIPELEKTEWKRLLFVFHQDLEPEAKLAALREEFGAVDVKQIRPPTWRGAGEPMLTFATVTPHAG